MCIIWKIKSRNPEADRDFTPLKRENNEKLIIWFTNLGIAIFATTKKITV